MSVELDSISSNGRGSESDASMNSQGQETLNQLTPETAGPPLQSTAQHQPTACQVDIMMEFDDTVCRARMSLLFVYFCGKYNLAGSQVHSVSGSSFEF